MDNAGGYGILLAIETCANKLRDEFSTHIIHQVPNLHEANLLDLSIWAAV